MNLNSFIIAKRISIVFILFILSFSVFLPDAIRDYKVFAVVLAMGITLAAIRVKNGIPNNNSLILLFVFCLICFIYSLFSMLFGNWTNNYLYDFNYIFRHSYFSLLMPIIILASMLIFKTTSKDINAFIANNAIKIMFAFISLDMLLAYIFGSQNFLINNDYTFYQEKGFIWLSVCYVFFFCMANRIRHHIIFSIVTIGFFAERILGYGSTFNASTGALFYLIMVASYFSWGLFSLNRLFDLYLKLMIITALLFVFIAPYYSDNFLSDMNTYWRLESWKSNLDSVIDNNSFGSGFGISYFPLRQDVIDWAYHAYDSGISDLYLVEHMFIRGQHSSIINITFRVGLIGVAIFLSFLASVFINHSKKDSTAEYKYLAPVFTCGILNISVHVGLESPPFLITFSIAAGFLIEAAQMKNKKVCYQN